MTTSRAEVLEAGYVVAVARTAFTAVKAHLRELQEAFDAEHATLVAGVKEGNAHLQEAESNLRRLAVEAYLADPDHNKTVLEGVVSIREVGVIGYNPVAALDWAMKHEMALRLDEKAYETLVKAGQAPGTLVTEPQAAIAREIKLPEDGTVAGRIT